MDKTIAQEAEAQTPTTEPSPVAIEVPGESTVVPAPRAREEELEHEAEREDPLGALSYRQLVCGGSRRAGWGWAAASSWWCSTRWRCLLGSLPRITTARATS